MIATALALCLLNAATGGEVRTLPGWTDALREAGGPAVVIAPELRNEAVYVRGVLSPTALRAAVARATRAEWVADGSHLRLERGGGLRRALRLEEERLLFADLKKVRDEVPSLSEVTTEEYASIVALGQEIADDLRGFNEASMDAIRTKVNVYRSRTYVSDPVLRLEERLTRAIDLKILTSLPVSTPTPFIDGDSALRSLPLDARPISDALAREARTALAAGFLSRYDLEFPAHADTLRLGLVIERTAPEVWVIGIWLIDGDRRGEKLFDFSIDATDAATPPDPSAATAKAQLKASIRLPDQMEVREALMARHVDPVAAFGTEWIEDALPSDDAVVCDLPDQVVAAFLHAPFSSVAGYPLAEGMMRWTEADGVRLGSPRLPLLASELRMRRDAFSRWLAQREAGGELSPRAEMAARVGPGGIATGLQEEILGGIGLIQHEYLGGADTSEASQLESFLLWRELAPGTRRTLDSGEPIPIGSLSEAAARAAWRCAVRAELPQIFFASSQRSEVKLAFKVEIKPVLVIADGSPSGRTLTAEEAGWSLRRWRDNPLSGDGRPDIHGRPVRIAMRTFRTLKFGDPDDEQSAVILVERVDPGDACTWDRLPPELLEEIQKARDSKDDPPRTN